MNKQELRTLYKQKRGEIASASKLKMDDLLLIRFQQLDFSEISSLLTYWPMAHTNEPNTLLFSSYLRHRVPGLRMAYPIMDAATHTMQAIEINEDTVYNTNQYGITEPGQGEILPATDIDLVLVPMLVCDKRGYRVGYGKGYYDRYLQHCRADTCLVGLSYFDPVEEITDLHEFDVPLDYCICPDDIYAFGDAH